MLNRWIKLSESTDSFKGKDKELLSHIMKQEEHILLLNLSLIIALARIRSSILRLYRSKDYICILIDFLTAKQSIIAQGANKNAGLVNKYL